VRHRRNLSVFQYFLLIVAISCLGLYGYVSIKRSAYQEYERWRFEKQLAAIPNRSQSVRTRTKIVVPPNSIIGEISVPRLRISAMVREGIDRSTLELAVGHIPGTALPDHPGNVGVAGHRDTFFRQLQDLKNRDRIRFSTPQGDFKYEVESMMVVEPDDVEVLAQSQDKVLTMVTCYPFHYIGTAPRRFIVRARQIEEVSNN
jgi:sortase A